MDQFTKRELKRRQETLKASFRFANFLRYMEPALRDFFNTGFTPEPPEKEDRELKSWVVSLVSDECQYDFLFSPETGMDLSIINQDGEFRVGIPPLSIMIPKGTNPADPDHFIHSWLIFLSIFHCQYHSSILGDDDLKEVCNILNSPFQDRDGPYERRPGRLASEPRPYEDVPSRGRRSGPQRRWIPRVIDHQFTIELVHSDQLRIFYHGNGDYYGNRKNRELYLPARSDLFFPETDSEMSRLRALLLIHREFFDSVRANQWNTD